ncbi:Tc toxin subunit A [Pseudomonas koreensis]|uniref:Virulence plasmid 28.1kDa A protein n=1 Tax=Pseudomonas koreensis TaxID=198620 RepID=A0AA94ES34_9PSED|nr:Tc toxin subunit A [Pseudomonas koreensis]RVD78889.1 virulence plasmid 28.1kDa A protein [Pseudomonas koreensis]
MTDPEIRPVVQLLEQVFSEEQRDSYTDFCSYLESGGSIFQVVELGIRGLVNDYDMQREDAQAFLRRANSLATFVRRRFIEHSLSGSAASLTHPDSGLLSMVAGPSYEGLFNPNFDELCPPQALESISSPVAYLIELLRWIDQRIFPVGGEGKLDLYLRRQDLKQLLVDFNAVHQSISALDIIVPVIETFISENNPEQLDLEDALINARYPSGLPYFQHWVTLDFVARQHGVSVGNITHTVDMNYPYFLQPEAWDKDVGRALSHASRLGPYQRELLTEAPVDPANSDARDSYYEHNFGTTGVEWGNLNQLKYFAERTGQDARRLEAALSIRDLAPTRSPNVSIYETIPSGGLESHRSGSVFVNAANSPALNIDYREDSGGAFHRLTAVPTTIDPYERMNRKLRLDRWLDLPSDQVDALLTAAIKAEQRGVTPAHPYWISAHSVHALGLFQSLRERYGCTAQDFAAFIDEVSIYGRAEVPSLFDSTFNSQGDYRQPLLLDAGEFSTLPAQGESELTISQLCSGLNIDLQTYAYLAAAIAEAHGLGEKLKRSTAVISSFYRLVKLPRLLGITPVEGVLMLTLLGGKSWINGLAGLPRIAERRDEDSVPDVLNLIYAMHSCASWCKDREMPVLWMLQQVVPPQALAVSTEAERQLFEQIRNLLSASLFSNAGLQAAGVPLLEGLDWLQLLAALVDPTGLVFSSDLAEADYLLLAREKLDQAVREGFGENDAGVRAIIVERMLSVLMEAREAQVSVARECLSVYTGLDVERSLRVLIWAQSTVYQLLSWVLVRAGQDVLQAHASEQPDPLLSLLADVRRRAAVVSKLNLSARLLEDFLQYGHKAWMDQQDRHLLSVRTLYYLSSLTHAFEMSKQPAEKLLDYLREVNELAENLSTDALWLAQQAALRRLAAFFDWSVQEVQECVFRIDSDLKILKNLSQLDLLLRIRVLAAHSGMDALTIFLMGNLPEAIDKNAYRIAAERALLSLANTRMPERPFSEEGLEPLVIMTCTADKTQVIANKPDEKIIFTVTLKTVGGKALSGVYVHWQTSLGTVVAKATEYNGTVQVEYLPGKVMGQEVPLFRVALIDPQQAPSVYISDDPETLFFPAPLKSQVPQESIPAGQEFKLFAKLQDNYRNVGRNRLVRWFATAQDGTATQVAEIRPDQNYTDRDGFTYVLVSSRSGGTFEFSVLCEASSMRAIFDLITFDAPPLAQ